MDNGTGTSTKKAGVILAGVLIVLALVIYFFSKISITKKPVTKSNNGVSSERVVKESNYDFDGDILSSTGTVNSKSIVSDGSQLQFILNISLKLGVSEMQIKYYCSYDTYAQVDKDETLTVNYKQVSDSEFAVMSVTK